MINNLQEHNFSGSRRSLIRRNFIENEVNYMSTHKKFRQLAQKHTKDNKSCNEATTVPQDNLAAKLLNWSNLSLLILTTRFNKHGEITCLLLEAIVHMSKLLKSKQSKFVNLFYFSIPFPCDTQNPQMSNEIVG